MILGKASRPSTTNTKKDVLFIIGDWNAKVGSQEIPGVAGKFGLGVQNEVAIIVNKSPKCSTWMQSQKRQNDLCSFPRQTIQYHSNPSLWPNQ